MNEENCVFCKIIKKEIPSYTLYEDDIVIAFLNIDQHDVGHTLIIPKKHYVDITDIPNDILNHMNETQKIIYNLLKEKLNFDGLQIIQNNGCLQEIKHYHLHLIPNYNYIQNELSIEEIYNILKK